MDAVVPVASGIGIEIFADSGENKGRRKKEEGRRWRGVKNP